MVQMHYYYLVDITKGVFFVSPTGKMIILLMDEFQNVRARWREFRQKRQTDTNRFSPGRVCITKCGGRYALFDCGEFRVSRPFALF